MKHTAHPAHPLSLVFLWLMLAGLSFRPGMVAAQGIPVGAPAIVTQPPSLFVPGGAGAAFSVTASGTPPLYYAWQKDGTNLTDTGNVSGSATSSLVLSTTSTNDPGSYTVVITNASGAATSSVAKLTLVLPAYYVTDLGGPNAATGINTNGQIAGFSTVAGDYYHAFLYTNGVIMDLGTLPGQLNSAALGINNLGQVVGFSGGDSSPSHAFLFSDGTMTDLGGLPGSTYNQACSINDRGLIAGYSALPGGAYFAVLFANGTVQNLGALPGDADSIAQGVNNAGQVVGASISAGGPEHAFLYQDGTMTFLGEFPGGDGSSATAINNLGQVTGFSYTADGYGQAFLYNAGTLTNLGTIPGCTDSYPQGINNHGQVVGHAFDFNGVFAGGNQNAFLYGDGTVYDLNNLINTNDLGTFLNEATGINDCGQITADGNNGHAYLLTPSRPGSYLTANFPPNLQAATVSPGNFILVWNTVNTWPAIAYQPQCATDVASTNWINLGGPLTGTGPTLSVTNSIASHPQAFYRVLLVP